MTISVVIKLIEIIQYKLNSMRLIEEPVTLKTITVTIAPKEIPLFRRIRSEHAYKDFMPFLIVPNTLFRDIIHVFCRLSSKSKE